jgi:hypothetical protein
MSKSGPAFSSTVREVRGALKGLQALAAAHPTWVTGHVQLWGDNLGAVYACQRMGGNHFVFQEVKALYVWAIERNLQLSFVWQPRDHISLQLADLLSKWDDPSDWQLSRTALQQQVFPHCGVPDLDCFASEKAHQSCCAGYFSQLWDHNCLAVDAWAQAWNKWPTALSHTPRARRKVKPLCFIFCAVGDLPRALRKIQAEHAEALVIAPRNLEPALRSRLALLPVSSTVSLNGAHRWLVKPTERVPKWVSRAGWVVPLQSVRISWD